MASVQEFFEGSAEPRARGSDRGHEQHVRLRHRGRGRLDRRDRRRRDRRHRGRGDADCTFSASEESFEKIVAGEQNATTAYMTGQAQDQGRHGRGDEAPEDLLSARELARYGRR